MIVEPFNMTHFVRLQTQTAQHWVAGQLGRSTIEAMSRQHSFAAVLPDRVLCCAGLVPIHPRRAVAWALCAEKIGGIHFRAIHRATLRCFKISGFERIEATVPCDFAEGHKWARLLGFEIEAERMIGFGEDGADHTLYRWRRGV